MANGYMSYPDHFSQGILNPFSPIIQNRTQSHIKYAHLFSRILS